MSFWLSREKNPGQVKLGRRIRPVNNFFRVFRDTAGDHELVRHFGAEIDHMRLQAAANRGRRFSRSEEAYSLSSTVPIGRTPASVFS